MWNSKQRPNNFSCFPQISVPAQWPPKNHFAQEDALILILYAICKEAPLWYAPTEPSTFKTHVQYLFSVFYDLVWTGFSESAHLTKKSTRAYPWIVFLREKSIWYSLNSKAHLDDLLQISGLYKTCLKRILVSTLIRWTWKYSVSFLAVTIKFKLCFSRGLYHSSRPFKMWLT